MLIYWIQEESHTLSTRLQEIRFYNFCSLWHYSFSYSCEIPKDYRISGIVSAVIFYIQYQLWNIKVTGVTQ